MRDFYRDVLGMGVTDYLGSEGVWLHINADHHVMALVGKTPAHFHHFALDLVDWGSCASPSTTSASTAAGSAGGPCATRSARTSAATCASPTSTCFVELYCDMEVLDLPHTAREWRDDPRGSNLWGILPPRSYFRFDEAAWNPSAISARRSARRCRRSEGRVRGRAPRTWPTMRPSSTQATGTERLRTKIMPATAESATSR